MTAAAPCEGQERARLVARGTHLPNAVPGLLHTPDALLWDLSASPVPAPFPLVLASPYCCQLKIPTAQGHVRSGNGRVLAARFVFYTG